MDGVIGPEEFKHREDFAAGRESSGGLGQNQSLSGLVGSWSEDSIIKKPSYHSQITNSQRIQIQGNILNTKQIS